jgi:quinoprotein glucose dehydrogenase
VSRSRIAAADVLPRVLGPRLVAGSATGEGYLSPPGDLRAYDVLTGALIWQFHTVPRPDAAGASITIFPVVVKTIIDNC